MRALLLTLALLGAGVARAQGYEEDEDPLDLVALLVRDARWDRAEIALAEVPTKRMKGDELARYRTLEGFLRVGQERWEDAIVAFRAAIAAADDPKHGTGADPTLHVQLAQALLKAGRAADAVTVLDAAPEAALALSSTWLLKAQASYAVPDMAGAFDALAEGATRFPTMLDFPRRQILLLVELGLYQEAGERGGAMIARSDATVEDVLVLAEALKRSGAGDRAANVLAQGRLRFPASVDVWVQSAAVAAGLDRPREAAQHLQVAAELDPALAHEAAELYRRAGDLSAAMRLNAEVVDPVKKARQRVGLLLEQEAWDQVLAMQARAERLGLLDDAAVAYGFAYARFRIRDLDGAEGLLRSISDPAVFQLATEMRAAMDACRDDPGACP